MVYMIGSCPPKDLKKMYYRKPVRKKNYKYSPRDSDDARLVKACKQGHIEVVKEQLRRLADPDCIVFHTTPLHAACKYRNFHVLKLLLKHADPRMVDRSGTTPYVFACENRLHEAAEILGNDPRVNPHMGRTFLNYPHMRHTISKAKQFNPNYEMDGETLLYTLCNKYNETPRTLQLLIQKGADVNRADDNGITPLMIACKNNHTYSMKVLLEHGANMHQKANNGHTAFTIACYYHRTGCIMLLLHLGAWVYDTYEGKSALDMIENAKCKKCVRDRIRNAMRSVEKWHVALLYLPTDVLRYIADFV
tara:strand:- start:29 stop:946 length:918 start_codon:yes stop_codon:yes gene_type:complete